MERFTPLVRRREDEQVRPVGQSIHQHRGEGRRHLLHALLETGAIPGGALSSAAKAGGDEAEFRVQGCCPRRLINWSPRRGRRRGTAQGCACVPWRELLTPGVRRILRDVLVPADPQQQGDDAVQTDAAKEEAIRMSGQAGAGVHDAVSTAPLLRAAPGRRRQDEGRRRRRWPNINALVGRRWRRRPLKPTGRRPSSRDPVDAGPWRRGCRPCWRFRAART